MFASFTSDLVQRPLTYHSIIKFLVLDKGSTKR